MGGPSILGQPPPCHFAVGGWLDHGDLALEARVDFPAVVEQRLIPARVRSEWAGLKSKGLASLWAPASQDSSHVGDAGMSGVSMRANVSHCPVSAPHCTDPGRDQELINVPFRWIK